MKTILDRSDFDLWFRRKLDGVLFAGSSEDHGLQEAMPLYENGHTLFEGGHPVRIFVERDALLLDFERMKQIDMVINGSMTVPGLTLA